LKKRLLTYIILFYLVTFWAVAQSNLPESPDLKRVTVDLTTGHAWIFWTLSPSSGVRAYNIYRSYEWGDDLITIINDSTATSYENIFSNADSYSESYVIAANLDTVRIGNERISPLTEKHTTIFLTLQLDSCLAELNLSWTPYIGWADSLDYYNIFRNTDGGSFSIISSLSPESLTFTDTTIEAYVNYCYYIQANHKNSLTSTSNKICKYTQMPRIPDFINADFASVNPENDEISLSFTIDPESEIYFFKLLRSENPDGIYDTIADFADHRSGKLTYSDTPEDLLSPFYYKLAAINACNHIIEMSNIASTMILTVNNEDALNHMTWTPNTGWKGGVENYEVYRKTTGNPAELISTVDADINNYTDNVELNNLIYTILDSRFCYYINAVEGENNPHGIKGSGTTAVHCVVLQPKIFIPNAFTPNGDGKNDAWFPKLSFTAETFHLIIKNRWGNIVFESKDQYKNWDGSYAGGETVKEGTYIWFLSVTTGTGETIVRKGIVNVIFP